MLKKDITFIWFDGADVSIYKPIIKEAKKRGYKTRLTQKVDAKCEIGFYCQHVNFPQYSKLSFIMLHDIIQAYNRWPDLWFKEPWDKYDVGILPSKQWENNWNKCSQYSYSRPRMGVYRIGWPKADGFVKYQNNDYRKKLIEDNGLDKLKKTVLYAPAWENDNKQDEFVQAMLSLDVNILIKQAPVNKEVFPEIVKNIKEMESLHRNIAGVNVLSPKTNIFDAIAMSDILVSDESSTMVEAAMMGIPAVSVSNWLIPDTIPSRYANSEYDFVIKTRKESLKECVEEILDNYDNKKKIFEEFSRNNFSNIGNTSSMIMDIVDDCINDIPIRYPSLNARAEKKLPIAREVKRQAFQVKQHVKKNYCVKYPVLDKIWGVVAKFKHIIMNK